MGVLPYLLQYCIYRGLAKILHYYLRAPFRFRYHTKNGHSDHYISVYLYICISVFGEGALVLLVCSQHALLSGQGWIPPTYILLDALGSLQKKNYTLLTKYYTYILLTIHHPLPDFSCGIQFHINIISSWVYILSILSYFLRNLLSYTCLLFDFLSYPYPTCLDLYFAI